MKTLYSILEQIRQHSQFKRSKLDLTNGKKIRIKKSKVLIFRCTGIFLIPFLFALIGPKESEAQKMTSSVSNCIPILQNLIGKVQRGKSWSLDNDTFVLEECKNYSDLILSINVLINSSDNPEALIKANNFYQQDPHHLDPSDQQYPLWSLVGAFLQAAPNGPTFDLEKSKDELVKLVFNSFYRKTYPLLWELSRMTLQNFEDGESLSSWKIGISGLTDVFREVESVRMMQSVWAAQGKRERSQQAKIDCSRLTLIIRLWKEAYGSLLTIFILFVGWILLGIKVIHNMSINIFNFIICKIDQIFSGIGTKFRDFIKGFFYASYMLLISIGNFILSRHISNDIFRLTSPSITGNCQTNWIDIWFMIDFIMIMTPWVFVGVDWLKVRKGLNKHGVLTSLVLSLPPLSILYPIVILTDINSKSIADATMLLSVLKDSLLVLLSILWAAMVERALFD